MVNWWPLMSVPPIPEVVEIPSTGAARRQIQQADRTRIKTADLIDIPLPHGGFFPVR
jgi:hypothetical protein